VGLTRATLFKILKIRFPGWHFEEGAELVTSYYTAQMSGFTQSGNLFRNFKSEILYSDWGGSLLMPLLPATQPGLIVIKRSAPLMVIIIITRHFLLLFLCGGGVYLPGGKHDVNISCASPRTFSTLKRVVQDL